MFAVHFLGRFSAIEEDLLLADCFDVVFEDCLCIRVEKKDGRSICTNAMNGYGEDCRDMYYGEEVQFYKKI